MPENTWQHLVALKYFFSTLAVIGVIRVTWTLLVGRIKEFRWTNSYGCPDGEFREVRDPGLFWSIFAGIFTILAILGWGMSG